MRNSRLLEVAHLSVEFGRTQRNRVRVLDDVNFDVAAGECVGLVGESGSGKTVTAMAITGLLRSLGAEQTGGTIRFADRDLAGLREPEMRRLRGSEIGMIFQQPTRALNPSFTVGAQLAETARVHMHLDHKAAWARSVEMLERVHLPNAAQLMRAHPFELSGGMSQRVMIAMALVGEPRLLIADEPTTALDVTVQAKIVALLQELQHELGLALIFVSHDLGVIAEICDRVNVMYCGQIVESGPLVDVMVRPQHPYTAGLLGSLPKPSQRRRLTTIAGAVPSFSALPPGCRFFDRCDHRDASVCASPIGFVVDRARGVRCARAENLTLKGAI